jgi:RHS repeat-associated protein
MFGLGSDPNQNADHTDIEYGIDLQQDGYISVWEGGSYKWGTSPIAVGDILRVAVEGGVVKYYRNNTLLYTSNQAPSYPLYLDTSIYATDAWIKDALIATTDSTPAYTSYYSFGGRVVGMRKQNYPTSNGQLRILGDHLGSSTLIVDTAATPVVVHRQYYKPYGEAIPVSGSSQTSVGYTGQRLDVESGLMYYGARYYDPVLSFFVSADNIAPAKGDAKTRNRYSYVVNNPIRYVDPSGHCHKDEHDPETCEKNEKKSELRKYGLVVDNIKDWTVNQLQALLDSISRLMSVMKWRTVKAFRTAMGIDTAGEIWLYMNVDKVGAGYGGAYYSKGNTNVGNPNKAHRNIVIEDTAVEVDPNNPTDLHSTFVHELAHAWDDAFGGKLSKGMAARTGSTTDSSGYHPGGHTASEYGEDSRENDWAEAVAGYAYPEEKKYQYNPRYDPKTGEVESGMDNDRFNFVTDQARIVNILSVLP